MAAVAEALQRAICLHRAGQLSQAEQLYRQVLQADATQTDALQLLGVIAHQLGRHELAIEYIGRAIALQPNQPVYYCNLGEAYRALGRTAEARGCYERALQLNPALAAAHYNLGLLWSNDNPLAAQYHYEQAIVLEPDAPLAHNNLGNLLRAQGKQNAAVVAYRAALDRDPTCGVALNNLATTLLDLGRHGEAIELLQRAAANQPGAAECHFQLGNAYRAAENWARAESCYRTALELKPDLIEAHCNLGITRKLQGDIAGAEQTFGEILRRKPDHVETLISYGSLLHQQGLGEQALDYYERALRIKPDAAGAFYNRAYYFSRKQMRHEAIADLREALRCQPRYPEAYALLASLYIEMHRPDSAIECCQQGLAITPRSAAMHVDLGLALHLQGRGAEAAEQYRIALEIDPANAANHSSYLFLLNFVPGLRPAEIFAEHLRWARKFAEPLTAAATPHDNNRTVERRLRVGYVSPHFCQHAVNFFSEPILTSHDRESFEVFCYSSVPHPDQVTVRIQSAVNHWREIGHLSDDELARTIRRDQVDILVDLSGHMGRNHLLAFARRPAPVQVTYLGYQNTTGLSAMDYRLTDEHADPPGLTDTYHTERLVRLPRSFFCYKPAEHAPDVTDSPAARTGRITFGSFNNYIKVTPAVIDTWLEILARVPDSRLLVLAYGGGAVEQSWRQAAARHGVDPTRVELCGRRHNRDYLTLIGQADIALDPFPFNGHTTTCDSLWMGVPVVMLRGQTYASRFGSSVHNNLGLEELVADSREEYIERAVTLAGDLPRLRRWRHELRPRMAASPLLDFAGFTRNLEAAYRQMWREWCAGQQSPSQP